eukprot:1378389-Amorphochlora_amoeboformis.AAC.1
MSSKFADKPVLKNLFPDSKSGNSEFGMLVSCMLLRECEKTQKSVVGVGDQDVLQRRAVATG